ncbi:MAG: peptidoglycan-binding domain-containing protein [Methanobacterium sp.]
MKINRYVYILYSQITIVFKGPIYWVLNGGGKISTKKKTTLAIAIAMCFALSIMPMASVADTTKQNTVSTDTNANQNLQIGMTDEKVTEAQKWLKNNNYYNGQIDGYFGIYTENGVKQFQKAAGIKVDGIVGPQTLNAMKAWDQGKAQVKTTSKSQKVSTKKVATSKSAAYGTTKKSTKSYRYASGSYSKYGGYINGMDCWAMSDYLASKYSAMGYTPVIRHAVTSLSSDHRWVEVNGQPVSDYGSLPNIYTPTG